MVWQPCLSPKVSSPGPKPGNGTTLVGLMRQTAQDAGVGRFEHILLCTDSMAEATVQTLPVRNCVVCSLSVPPFFFPTIVAQKLVIMPVRREKGG